MDFSLRNRQTGDNDFGHGKGRIDAFQLGSLPGNLQERRLQEWRILPSMLCPLFSLQSVNHVASTSSNSFTRRAERTRGIAAFNVPAVCRAEAETKSEGGRDRRFEEGLRSEEKRAFRSSPALQERLAQQRGRAAQ